MSIKFFDTGKPIKFTTGATKTFWNPSVGFKSEKDSGSDMDYAFWDELKDFYSKETTEGSESEIASILADQARGELDLLYGSGLPESEKAALLADYLQRSGFSADIVPQLSGGQLTKEDVVSTLAKYGYGSSGQQLPSTEERGAILGGNYPFANQAMGTTEVTQGAVNEILARAIAARQEIMGGTAYLTVSTENAAFGVVYSGSTQGWKLTEVL